MSGLILSLTARIDNGWKINMKKILIFILLTSLLFALSCVVLGILLYIFWCRNSVGIGGILGLSVGVINVIWINLLWHKFFG